jgi:hypothetical protein
MSLGEYWKRENLAIFMICDQGINGDEGALGNNFSY